MEVDLNWESPEQNSEYTVSMIEWTLRRIRRNLTAAKTHCQILMVGDARAEKSESEQPSCQHRHLRQRRHDLHRLPTS